MNLCMENPPVSRKPLIDWQAEVNKFIHLDVPLVAGGFAGLIAFHAGSGLYLGIAVAGISAVLVGAVLRLVFKPAPFEKPEASEAPR